MKRIIALSIALTVLLQIGAITATYADDNLTATYEQKATGQRDPLIYQNGQQPELVEVNGEKYFLASLQGWYPHPLKYDERAYDFLKNQTDCIWTGEYYMARDSRDDAFLYMKFFRPDSGSVKFYDKDFNLVHEQDFNAYVQRIEYNYGKYYCLLYGASGYVTSSTDMINWNKEDSLSTFHKNGGNLLVNIKDANNDYQAVSISGSDLYKFSFEHQTFGNANFKFGDYLVTVDKDGMYFSTNGFYWIKSGFSYSIPSDLNINFSTGDVYEWGDDIVYDASDYILKTPKQPIYDALEDMKSAPYVSLNNKVLFPIQSPVVQDGRILVPMRFLFEQMGASVDWDAATQTASVSSAGQNVSFQVNSTSATVNGTVKTMDVPAEIVNGKTMVPLRFLSEGLGYTVQWDAERNMATISK